MTFWQCQGRVLMACQKKYWLVLLLAAMTVEFPT
jgi:hypothetical protein